MTLPEDHRVQDDEGVHDERVVHIEPLDVDGVHTIAVGSVLWLLGFLALLPFVETLQDSGRVWWLWTSLAGLGFGLLGVEYCRRRRNALREGDSSSAAETSRFGAAG